MDNLTNLWYHYDPAVLVVAITWHQTEVKFGEYLHTRLGLAYTHNHESVHVHRWYQRTLQPTGSPRCYL